MNFGRIDRITALAACTALGLTACERQPLSPSAPHHFQASVAGSVNAEYHGTGFFRMVPHRAATGFGFFLTSRGSGEAASQEFHVNAATRPEAGRYRLGSAEDVESGRIGFQYHVFEGSDGWIYVAEEGELVVSSSSEARVEGTFRLTARQVAECESGPGWRKCGRTEPGADPPTVEISGSFEAVPFHGQRIF